MSLMNRRVFLKRSAYAGVIVLAGGRRSAVGYAANNTINVGVAGLNGRGGDHVAAYLGMEDVAIRYLIDPDARTFGKHLKKLQDKSVKPTCVQDVRKALEDKDLHVISIATCNHWHALMTIWACQAGKDVYVEKPMSHNVREGRIAVDTARKYKRIVQHGTQGRSGGAWKRLQENASGKRGRLLVVRGQSIKGRSSIGTKPQSDPPKELDFDIWLGPAPKQPYHANLVHYNWHWFWDTGNGDIGNNGVHAMDAARWLIPNATLPTKVFSLGGRFAWKDQGQTPNLQFAIFDYGQTKLIFEVSNLKTGRDNRPSTVFAEGSAPAVEIKHPPDVRNPASERGPGRGIFGNFIACVRSRRSEDLDAHVEEAHYSSALCHLANISYRLGKDVPFGKDAGGGSNAFGDDKEAYRTWEWFQDTVKDSSVKLEETTYRLGRTLTFDPKTEKFIGDDEANSLLTRPARPPFAVPDRAL